MKSLIRHGVAFIGCTGVVFVSYLSFKGDEKFYKSVLMPAVRLMDAEKSHSIAVWLAAKGLIPRDEAVDPQILVKKCHVVSVLCPMSINHFMH